jgi:hypothetical protein
MAPIRVPFIPGFLSEAGFHRERALLEQPHFTFADTLWSRISWRVFFRGFLCAPHCKRGRGKVSFDSQNDKYASQLSSDASPESYLSLRKSVFVKKM